MADESTTAPRPASANGAAGERRLAALFEQTAAGLAETTLDGRFINVNARYCELVGRSSEDLLSLRMQDITVPDDLPHNLALFERLIETGEPFEIEKRYVRPDGSEVWVRNTVSLVKDEAGAPVSVLAVSIDVTTSKVSEDALRESQARLKHQSEQLGRMFEQAPSMMALLRGPQHVFELANPGYMQLIGHRDVLGKPVREALPEVAGQGFFELLDQVYRSGEAFVGSGAKVRLQRTPGAPLEERFVDFVYQPLTDAQDQVTGIFVEATDVTDRIRAEVLRALQSQILELAIHDIPLAEALERLVLAVEEQSSAGVIGSILLLDEDGTHLRHGAAPSLPDTYNEAIDGIGIGPDAGSCGTAAHARAPVYVADIGSDPRWKDFRELAFSHGLRACWSTPILTGTGDVLGTFAMYYREPREPTPSDLELVDFVTRSASLVIERKQAATALRTSEERLRLVVDGATDYAILTTDPERRITSWSTGAEAIFGYSADEAIGRCADELWTPEDRAAGQPVREVATARATGCANNERWHLRADGRRVFLNGSVHPLPPLPDGSERGFIKIARDETGRREAEAALRESEERYRSLFDAIDSGFCIVEMMFDQDGRPVDYRFLEVNSAFERQTGLKDAAGQTMRALAPAHEEHWFEIYGQVALTGEPARFENRAKALDERWYDVHAYRTGRPEDRHVAILFNDISDRKHAETALREERNRLDTLNRTGAALSRELELDKVVQMVTDAGVELTGAQFGAFFYNVRNEAGESYMLYTLSGADRSDFEGFPMPRNTAVFGPTFAGTEIVRSDDITKDPRYGKNKPHKGMPDGHLPVKSYLAVPVTSHTGEVIGGLFFGHPEAGRFTERHERLMVGIAAQAAVSMDNARLYQEVQRANETLEQRVDQRTKQLETANETLRQAQKMEAIGQLTGGIAHDFNNMLTVIRGSADMLQRPGIEDRKRQRYLEGIVDTADRASRLTGQLLAFARRQALKPEKFDALTRVQSIAEMLHTVLGSSIELQISADCDDCFVEADAAQFETALVNMAINARDAMEGEGRLEIRVSRAGELPPLLRSGAAGPFVAISVSDSGHGIPPEAMDKIFEPFFTTKDVGKGTGLGLSQVYGFAKQSGGEVGVVSKIGSGPSFTLYLPEAEQDAAGSAESPAAEPALKPGGKVLIVEDNEDVGRFAEQALAELGFSVRLAGNADEAMAMLEQDHGFEVVFSDVVMPGTDGFDLAREIERRWPQLPVVLTSGYSHVLAGNTAHGFPLLQKPYSLEALQQALLQALRG